MTNVNVPAHSDPSFSKFFMAFAKIGFLSFGGPAAQIALMHRVLVDEQKRLGEKSFLNALSFCMLLPGPEAMQLATYAGWRLRGVTGGLVAGLLFVMPGAFVILALASVYAYLGEVPLVGALFLGVKAAVLVIVVEALLRVSKKALNGTKYIVLAVCAFIGVFFLALPYPLIVLAAAILGAIWGIADVDADGPAGKERPSLTSTAVTVVIWLAIWWIPVLALDAIVDQPILRDIGAFFSKLAVVTFGGAYAVLAYMGQEVVRDFGWLGAGEMMDGLGLAETTPGPLILVTEFVGFLAAFREGGFWLGVMGAVVTLWVTFAPCFLWIFAGAPYIELISAQPRLAGALSAITAAVVGVILNLSIWFGLHVLFGEVTETHAGFLVLWLPDLTTLNLPALGISVLCGYLLLMRHWGIMPVLAVAATLGAVTGVFS